jgi:hypothetical protein
LQALLIRGGNVFGELRDRWRIVCTIGNFGNRLSLIDAAELAQVRFRGEANVNRQHKPAAAVENDPNVWSGRALQEVWSTWQMRSCINVSGL